MIRQVFIPFKIEHEPQNRQRHAPVTYAFLLGYLCIWIYTGVILDEATREHVFFRFGMSRFEYHWWGFLSCTFLHGGFWHLFGNSLFFWLYGTGLEKLLGSGKFLLLYVVGAFLSGHIHILSLSELQAYEPCIGASGAVSAVLGCFFVMLPRAKLRCLFFSPISFRPLVILAPAWLILGIWFSGQLLFTLGVFGINPKIAFWAHVAGFTTGALAGTLWDLGTRRRLHKWTQRLRTPLAEAWDFYRLGQFETAQQRLAAMPETHPEARACRSLLEGCLHLQEDVDRGMAQMLLAFTQARNYHNEALQLTLYLQMRQQAGPDYIPAAIHRQAGIAALALKQDALAVTAFGYSLGGDVEERELQMLQGLETLCAERADRLDLSVRIQKIRRQLEPDVVL